jgi:hypothetical protein
MGQIEEVWRYVLGCHSLQPFVRAITPFSISNFYLCGGLEQHNVLIVAWEGHALPWLGVISLVIP